MTRRASSRFTHLAQILYDVAPIYRGQLPRGTRGQYTVWERFRDGSAIVRSFDDEDLAAQCAMKLGAQVEKHELAGESILS